MNKKMNTLNAVLAMIIFIISIVLIVRAYTTGVDNTGTQYIVNDKFFGEPEELRFWITPNNPAIKKQAELLKNNEELGTIIKTYDWLEEDYHYEEDDAILLNNGHIILKGGQDFWQLPIMVLAQKEQNGSLYVDCEDGTFLLVSLLRANNIKAYANIGTVTLSSGIYGHAWATVEVNGKTYLLETTLGENITELKPVPSFYKTTVRFNERELYCVSGEDINKIITIYPPLPPKKIIELKNALKGSE